MLLLLPQHLATPPKCNPLLCSPEQPNRCSGSLSLEGLRAKCQEKRGCVLSPPLTSATLTPGIKRPATLQDISAPCPTLGHSHCPWLFSVHSWLPLSGTGVGGWGGTGSSLLGHDLLGQPPKNHSLGLQNLPLQLQTPNARLE